MLLLVITQEQDACVQESGEDELEPMGCHVL